MRIVEWYKLRSRCGPWVADTVRVWSARIDEYYKAAPGHRVLSKIRVWLPIGSCPRVGERFLRATTRVNAVF